MLGFAVTQFSDPRPILAPAKGFGGLQAGTLARLRHPAAGLGSSRDTRTPGLRVPAWNSPARCLMLFDMSEPAQPELTFLFTDIEQSTGLVRELGAAYCDVLAASRSLLRHAVAEHGGREIECRADEFFAVFTSAEAAVAAATDAQRSLQAQDWPDGASVTVRMGLHTGTALDEGYGLVGLDVHRAARISSAGHGGQVLLSPRTAELAACGVQDLGRYELAGLPEPEQLFQLVADGLATEFPPLRRARRVDDLRLRVVLADDSVLVREGIARLLEEAGMHVLAQAGTGDELLEQVSALRPDVAVVDIRMPPSGSDEGLRAAKAIRGLFPEVGVLLLSQALEPAYARELLETGGESVGYLLKDRVADMQEFTRALLRIAAGDVVLDDGLTAPAA
jgi:class 3 adenylate cyclase/CheY-like chemotaxis protein